MQLFSGTACFSPSVESRTIDIWLKHGGVVARSRQQRRQADYYFCVSGSDSWLPSLLKNAIAVFSARWIVDSIQARFPLPCASYVLDRTSFPGPSAALVFHRQDSPGYESPTLPVETGSDGEDQEVVRSMLAVKSSQKRRYEEDNEEELDSDHRPSKRARFNNAARSRMTPPPSPPRPKPTVKVVRFPSPPADRKKIREIDFTKVKIRKFTRFHYEKINARAPDRPTHALPASWNDLLERQRLTDPAARISIKEALSALQTVFADKCVLFVPSQVYCGKEFRCFRVENSKVQ